MNVCVSPTPSLRRKQRPLALFLAAMPGAPAPAIATITSHQVNAFLSPHLSPHADMLETPGNKRRKSPDSVVDSVVESVIARKDDLELFRRSMEAMLQSNLPTQFILGKVVEDVIHDGVVNDRDDAIISRALEKQQEVWNLIMLTDTLLLGITFGQTMVHPEAHDDFDEATAATISACYSLLMTLSCVGFLLGAALTGLVYAYTKVLYQPDDIIWFLVSVQHQAPIVLMISSLVVFFIGGLVGSYITHGPVLGLVSASIWLVALVCLAFVWNTMRRSLMTRFTQEHKLRRTLHGHRTAAKQVIPPRLFHRSGLHGSGAEGFGNSSASTPSSVHQRAQDLPDAHSPAVTSPFITSTKHEHPPQSGARTSLV